MCHLHIKQVSGDIFKKLMKTRHNTREHQLLALNMRIKLYDSLRSKKLIDYAAQSKVETILKQILEFLIGIVF